MPVKTVQQNSGYDLKSVKLPRLVGLLLKIFINILESPLRGLLIPGLFKSAGIHWLRQRTFKESPTYFPIHYIPNPAKDGDVIPEEDWPQDKPAIATGFQPCGVIDYARAYRDGKITPESIAENVLLAIEEGERNSPPLRAMIAWGRQDVLEQAHRSTKRIQEGKARSVFEGVPVAVKDEVDMRPFPTTVGTAFLGKEACKEDSTVVARLRAAGALLIGKTNMHEIGIGVTGLNPIHGTPRNPYNLEHFTGGSSSGSAAAVAAGLCPVAVGADGGGSIRVPASLCGIFGMKPTFGRISEHGAAPLCWSVAHLGPLAATAIDTALGYAVMAGPDKHDPMSQHQPAPILYNWDKTDLSDLSVGIYPPWFRHAAADVVESCEEMLRYFQESGVVVREVTIPDLEASRIAHTLTIAGEMAQALDEYYENHHREHGADVRINLALARQFRTTDYMKSQRVRTRLISNVQQALSDVDVIITPATGLTAPVVPEDALKTGESDLTTLIEIMRFATLANLTGLPAISFPVGYNENKMPVGMQVIGRAWQEQTLLRFALAAEKKLERLKPQIYYDLLGT